MTRRTRTLLQAGAFILATLAATSLLVAAGLAEERQPEAAACIGCAATPVHRDPIRDTQ